MDPTCSLTRLERRRLRASPEQAVNRVLLAYIRSVEARLVLDYAWLVYHEVFRDAFHEFHDSGPQKVTLEVPGVGPWELFMHDGMVLLCSRQRLHVLDLNNLTWRSLALPEPVRPRSLLSLSPNRISLQADNFAEQAPAIGDEPLEADEPLHNLEVCLSPTLQLATSTGESSEEECSGSLDGERALCWDTRGLWVRGPGGDSECLSWGQLDGEPARGKTFSHMYHRNEVLVCWRQEVHVCRRDARWELLFRAQQVIVALWSLACAPHEALLLLSGKGPSTRLEYWHKRPDSDFRCVKTRSNVRTASVLGCHAQILLHSMHLEIWDLRLEPCACLDLGCSCEAGPTTLACTTGFSRARGRWAGLGGVAGSWGPDASGGDSGGDFGEDSAASVDHKPVTVVMWVNRHVGIFTCSARGSWTLQPHAIGQVVASGMLGEVWTQTALTNDLRPVFLHAHHADAHLTEARLTEARLTIFT